MLNTKIDSGGPQADSGGGGEGAGDQPAEGFGAGALQAGGVLGGAADALCCGAAA